ncbi:MAG: LysM peptidoglycan-binding domain-containing protein [Phycisphaeraceae bacterium]|nr:MAG: LysM peptidoglycan-binding domain-containing protein [Phycisphaeraceae bacterium]
MSLPSQTARTSPAGRSFVYRRRRNRHRPSPIVVVSGAGAAIVVIALGLYFFGPSWGGPKTTDARPTGDTPTDPLITSPLPESDQKAGTLVINQGSQGDTQNQKPTVPAKNLGDNSQRLASSTTPLGSRSAPPPLNDKGMLDEALSGEGSGAKPAVSQPVAPANTITKDDPPARVIQMHLDAADELLKRNDPLAARQALWDAMRMPGLDELELSVLRARLTDLNKDLVFGPTVIAGDPLSTLYTVQPNDALSRIARSQHLSTHWKLIQRVNGLSSPERIRVGQKLKLVPGPFHAIVDKSSFRLDLFAGPPDRPEAWVYIRSFDVGLGEGDSTPVGHFIVRPNSKLENPSWVNPRNPSEKFAADDPQNPIGEYWIGLEGLGDSAAYAGYGLHGTIDLGSIGRQRSMGCVRMRPDDIELVYECLSEGESLVQIRE